MFDIAALFLDAWRRFADDDGWAISSHIALAALTSMFPFLIFLTALAGFFGSKELAAQATAILLETWPRRVAEPLAQEIHAVLTQGRSGLLTFGIVLAVYFSSNAVEALRIGLNRAYDQIDPRPWWLLRLESIAYVLLGAATMLALGLLLVLGPLLFATALRYAPGLADLQRTVTLARYGIVALLLWASLVVAHKYIAAGRRPLRAIAPGIALTLVLSLVFAEGFGTYLAEFAGNYVSTYAGLASAMIALVFLYTLAAIFVYGAELNGAMLSAREGRGGEKPTAYR